MIRPVVYAEQVCAAVTQNCSSRVRDASIVSASCLGLFPWDFRRMRERGQISDSRLCSFIAPPLPLPLPVWNLCFFPLPFWQFSPCSRIPATIPKHFFIGCLGCRLLDIKDLPPLGTADRKSPRDDSGRLPRQRYTPEMKAALLHRQSHFTDSLI